MISQEGQITGRFTQAIDHLGSNKLQIRLGGIYALERIARDSERDHWPIMEVLTAYIRTPREENGLKQDEESKRDIIPPDIQAILTVLGRRKRAYEKDNQSLDLREADLRGADLRGADFRGADLRGANFWRATLTETKLQEALLWHAKLQEAYLNHTELQGASLWGASLRGALLNCVNVQGTDLRDAAQDLGPENIRATTKNWEQAIYDEDFCIKLGLVPKPAEET